MYIHIHAHIYTHIYIYIGIYVYMYIYVYTYIFNMHTHLFFSSLHQPYARHGSSVKYTQHQTAGANTTNMYIRIYTHIPTLMSSLTLCAPWQLREMYAVQNSWCDYHTESAADMTNIAEALPDWLAALPEQPDIPAPGQVMAVPLEGAAGKTSQISALLLF